MGEGEDGRRRECEKERIGEGEGVRRRGVEGGR